MTISSFLLEDVPCPKPPLPRPPLPVLSGPGGWTPPAAFLSPFPVGAGEVPVPLGDPLQAQEIWECVPPPFAPAKEVAFSKICRAQP